LAPGVSPLDGIVKARESAEEGKTEADQKAEKDESQQEGGAA
jgi:hypothetical protein